MKLEISKPVTNLVSPLNPIEVPIVASYNCMRGKSASFIRHIEFDLSGTILEGAFSPGQSIGVTPPGLDEKGQAHGSRKYSISSPSFGEDGNGCRVSTTCKRVVEEFNSDVALRDGPENGLFLGVCSNFLCGRKVGDTVLVSGPSGTKFRLPDNQDRHGYVFIATGTGIAPFRGMVKELLDGPHNTVTQPIHLIMGAPYTSDLLYDDYFRRVAETHPNFYYHTTISREPAADGRPQGYVHDYLARTDHAVRHHLEKDDTLLYICGLKGMQTGVFKYLVRSNLANDYLKVPTNLEGTDPETWTSMMTRRVRPKARCLVEVY